MRLAARLCFLYWCGFGLGTSLLGAETESKLESARSTAATNTPPDGGASNVPRFTVRAYETKGEPLLPTDTQAAIFAKYLGTNISLPDIVKAASDLLLEYRQRGCPTASVAIAQERITNGIVTMNVFRGRFSQVLVSGHNYWGTNPASGGAQQFATALAAANTNKAASAATNASPRFAVRAYEIRGDTLLTDATLTSILVKYTGTNIGIEDITKAAAELQMEYRDRGFPTVSVTIPQQQIQDGMVKLRIFQGRLSDIMVTGNRYFSSNNIMRTLPSLRTNTILNGPVFQAELDRANANADRQIYPQIQPGLEPNTTELLLKVNDRLPLHAKMDFNNQSSPGTPDLRINSSAVYNNLWQLEHSVGVQYSFSSDGFKSGDQWAFYDLPLVVNYSAFYRLPLGNPEPIAAAVASQPGTFGYDEASRKFRLPPSSLNVAELSVYGSRSSIDTGVQTVFSTNVFSTNAPNGNSTSLDRRDVQQDITITKDIGFRLSVPGPATADFHSTFLGGADYKGYQITTTKTNTFTVTTAILEYGNDPVHPQTNVDVHHSYSSVPTTYRQIDYLPLTLRYDASLRDPLGVTTLGLGVSGNVWYSGSTREAQILAGSAQSDGYWVALYPSFSREFFIHTNWVLTLRAAGQWADQPLISNEQFGIGGVNTVRGYQEGEVFGDSGWWAGIEQSTPGYVVGLAGGAPLTVRGSVYMEYGQTYLIEPLGRRAETSLWGAGFGGVATLGSHFGIRLLFSWPLLGTPTTQPGQPRFDFSLTAQF